MNKFVLDREDTALVVIDIQEKLAAAMADKDSVIANNDILLDTAKELELPIIATEQYPKGLGRTVPELLPKLETGRIFAKMSFDACAGPLEEALRATERNTVIVTGIETHVCVYQTVRSFIEAGFTVHVPCDAVTSRTEANKENGLALMEALGAVITNTETVVFDLIKIAGTPEFKTLSSLIK